ncbi:MAG: hypothetical protein Kow00124_24640 [Anaerolineae bacterium]
MKIKLVAVIGLMIASLAVAGVTQTLAQGAPAVETVTLVTPYARQDVPIYRTSAGKAPELVGTFDVIDLNFSLRFTWQPDPYEQVDFEHTAYRVFLRQYFPWSWPYYDPLDFDQTLLIGEDYQEIRSAFHWASNPNHTDYVIPYLDVPVVRETDEWLCAYCPTRVVVQPYTFEQYRDPLTGVYEYRYTPLPGGVEQWSEVFVIRKP